MKKILFYISILIAFILLTSCSRKQAQIIYKDKLVSTVDTITINSVDTIPCENFSYIVETKTKDTIYVKVVDKQLQIKYVTRKDTIYRETFIVQPQPLKSVTKIDNSVKNKATKGSAVGDGNTITTKKTNWWWIFLSGALTWLVIQNVGFRLLKKYVPFLSFLA